MAQAVALGGEVRDLVRAGVIGALSLRDVSMPRQWLAARNWASLSGRRDGAGPGYDDARGREERGDRTHVASPVLPRH